MQNGLFDYSLFSNKGMVSSTSGGYPGIESLESVSYFNTAGTGNQNSSILENLGFISVTDSFFPIL